MYWSTGNFYRNKYVEYFAFDKESFYYKYNIAEKSFDSSRKIFGNDSSISWSGFIFNDDRTEEIQFIFDNATGILEIRNRKQDGSIYFSCNKIGKNKLPRSKF